MNLKRINGLICWDSQAVRRQARVYQIGRPVDFISREGSNPSPSASLNIERKLIMSKSNEELVFQAEKYLFDKKFEKAIKLLKKVLKTNPMDASIRKSIGLAYFELAKYDDALKNFIKSSEIEVNDSDLWSYMGRIYLLKKEKEKALWCLKKALEIEAINYDDEFEDLIGFGIKEKIDLLESEGVIAIDPDLDPKYVTCPKCKNEILIDKNSKFCRICGNRV